MTLPAGYSLPLTTLDPTDVGTVYHLAIGTKSSPALAAPDRIYGFMLVNEQGSEFGESTDLYAKSQLTQYSSQNLIDRDLVSTPRVSQGSFAGGAFQPVALDQTKYMDADLATSVPGYLFLAPQWVRSSKAGLTIGANKSVVAWNGDFWFTFSEVGTKNIYSANGGTTVALPVTPLLIDTDGSYLYFSDGATLYRRSTAGVNTQVCSALNGGGTAQQIWVINQGTNGYRCYYLGADNNIYFVDLTKTASFPYVAGATQPQLAMGSVPIAVVDLVAYGTQLAILSNDVAGFGMDVWIHDGQNMTRSLRLDGYSAQGMCVCLGDIYFSAAARGNSYPPLLGKISAGTYERVAAPGSPFPVASQGCLQPRSSDRFVYWPITGPSLKQVSNAAGYIVRLDVVTGEVTHLPVMDATDFTSQTGPLRTLAILGAGVAFAFQSGTTGILQYQATAFGSLKFQTSGQLVTSLIDFATPSISKLLRRAILTHRPLNAGESLKIDAYVDKDPLTQALGAPNATVTNSVAGTTTSILQFTTGTLGKSVFLVFTLTAGTNQATTPIIYRYSIEVAVGWSWKFKVGARRKVMTLSANQEDMQNLTGRDRYWFIHELQELASPVTFYHPNQLSYVAAVETIDLKAKDPVFKDVAAGPADLEFTAEITLRWSTE